MIVINFLKRKFVLKYTRFSQKVVLQVFWIFVCAVTFGFFTFLIQSKNRGPFFWLILLTAGNVNVFLFFDRLVFCSKYLCDIL